MIILPHTFKGGAYVYSGRTPDSPVPDLCNISNFEGRFRRIGCRRYFSPIFCEPFTTYGGALLRLEAFGFTTKLSKTPFSPPSPLRWPNPLAPPLLVSRSPITAKGLIKEEAFRNDSQSAFLLVAFPFPIPHFSKSNFHLQYLVCTHRHLGVMAASRSCPYFVRYTTTELNRLREFFPWVDGMSCNDRSTPKAIVGVG